MSKNEYDVCIIGAGIIGASIAREFSKFNIKILVLEANPSFGLETTSGNSGLIHGGFDPTPHKLNAKLNQLGKKRYYDDWFKQLDFSHKQMNSLILAFNMEEEKHLEMLIKRGLENGCTKDEIYLISKEQIKEFEPNISDEVSKALLCNSSTLIDPFELTGVLLKNAKKNNVEVIFNQKVNTINYIEDQYNVCTQDRKYKTKFIINCAGHYADVISQLAGFTDFECKTKRGEYIILKPNKYNSVNNVLFMVPTIHGKGVIVSQMLDGNLLVGPTAEDNVAKDETRLITEEKLREIKQIGKKIIPNLDVSKICARFAGSRSIYADTNDFYIEYASGDKHFINVAGIKSPGISAAPAIADYVINMVKKIQPLDLKPGWDPYEKNILYS